jgi:ribosomal protein S12 methylthiotransferase accessory factor
MLRAYPFRVQQSASEQYSILLVNKVSHIDIQAFNAAAIKNRDTWLLVKPIGPEVLIGPLFVPGKKPCFSCFLERYRMNRQEEWVAKEDSSFCFGEEIACRMAINEFFKWIVLGPKAPLDKYFFSYDVIHHRLTSHVIVERPQCTICGSSSPAWTPLVLKDGLRPIAEDGGFRTVSAETTYKTYEHLISPLTGIIGTIRPLASSRLSYQADYVGHTPKKINFLDFRGISGGKGRTEAQAKASCLGEAIERHSMIYRGDEVQKRGSYRALKEETIDPRTCLHFSETQYQIREEWNQKCDRFHRIPYPFDETEKIDWSAVWSLTENRKKWIPTAFGFYHYPFVAQEKAFCWADSNGCAAGNTKEEAILQGFFELVERDSMAIWWYNKLSLPSIDLTQIDDIYIQSLLTYYASLNRKVWVLDLTFDLDIPVFVALSCKSQGPHEELLIGSGAHRSAKIALTRALTELNLVYDGMCQLFSRESSCNYKPFQPLRSWFQTAKLRDHPHFLPESVRLFQNTLHRVEDLKEEIIRCQKIVEAKGLEFLVLDQTRADIGMPVVKVIVPGLRHFWNRFAPGRLYDVPVSLGKLTNPLKEEQLNDVLFFL